MERTESVVVQVAPTYENAKIQEMESFGWNLQGRQEIHEKGDAYGAPSMLGDAYIIKTKVSQYVKLHFARSSTLPNIQAIKRIEAKYSALPFPNGPSVKWPIGLSAFFALGLLIGNPQDPVTARLFFGALTALCVFWVYRRIQKRTAARAICEQSLATRNELIQQVSELAHV